MKSILVIGAIVIFTLWMACESSGDKPGDIKVNTSSGSIEYTPPDEWISEMPSSSMRKAQYKLPGKGNSGAAELAVFHFPGTGGSVDANLERWYGQFTQPDGSPTRDHVEKKIIDANDLKVIVVYTTGIYLQSNSPMMGGPVEEKPDFAMLAAIAESSQGPWFFKAVGPQQTIDSWREEFGNFVKTFRKSAS